MSRIDARPEVSLLDIEVMAATDRELMVAILQRCNARTKRLKDGTVRVMIYLKPSPLRTSKPRRRSRRIADDIFTEDDRE